MIVLANYPVSPCYPVLSSRSGQNPCKASVPPPEARYLVTCMPPFVTSYRINCTYCSTLPTHAQPQFVNAALVIYSTNQACASVAVFVSAPAGPARWSVGTELHVIDDDLRDEDAIEGCGESMGTLEVTSVRYAIEDGFVDFEAAAVAQPLGSIRPTF